MKKLTIGTKICLIVMILWTIDLLINLIIYGFEDFLYEGGLNAIAWMALSGISAILIQLFFKKK